MIKVIFTSIISANFMLIAKMKFKGLQKALENWQETGNDFSTKVYFSLDRTSQFTALFQIHGSFPVSY